MSGTASCLPLSRVPIPASATVGGTAAAALMLATSRPGRAPGAPSFGRGALACVERAFRAQSATGSTAGKMPVTPRMQVIPAVVSRVAGNADRPASAISIEEPFANRQPAHQERP